MDEPPNNGVRSLAPGETPTSPSSSFSLSRSRSSTSLAAISCERARLRRALRHALRDRPLRLVEDAWPIMISVITCTATPAFAGARSGSRSWRRRRARSHFSPLPGQAYESGMGFIQNYFGLPFALIVVCAVFIPIYHRLKVVTAYEYLEQRFDKKTRLLGAFLFLLQRGLAAGITIYAPAIILSALLGWKLNLTILLSGFSSSFTPPGRHERGQPHPEMADGGDSRRDGGCFWHDCSSSPAGRFLSSKPSRSRGGWAN